MTTQRIVGKVLAALVIACVTPIVWAFERWDRSMERGEF